MQSCEGVHLFQSGYSLLIEKQLPRYWSANRYSGDVYDL